MTPPAQTRGQWLGRTLLSGFFIVAPLGLSFLVLAWLVTVIDRSLAFLLPLGNPPRGLGLAAAFLLILVAGLLGSNFMARHIFQFVEGFLLKVPVFNSLYKTIKQVSAMFSSGKLAAGGVVLIEFPRPGAYSLGFFTKELELEKDGAARKMAAVYVPTNQIYLGTTVLVPADEVRKLSMSAQEGIKAMLSAGASLPEVLRSNPPA